METEFADNVRDNIDNVIKKCINDLSYDDVKSGIIESIVELTRKNIVSDSSLVKFIKTDIGKAWLGFSCSSNTFAQQLIAKNGLFASVFWGWMNAANCRITVKCIDGTNIKFDYYINTRSLETYLEKELVHGYSNKYEIKWYKLYAAPQKFPFYTKATRAFLLQKGKGRSKLGLMVKFKQSRLKETRTKTHLYGKRVGQIKKFFKTGNTMRWFYPINIDFIFMQAGLMNPDLLSNEISDNFQTKVIDDPKFLRLLEKNVEAAIHRRIEREDRTG